MMESRLRGSERGTNDLARRQDGGLSNRIAARKIIMVLIVADRSSM